MTDERALLTAILEEPNDDTRKLVYADWLDEHGDPRAEYLRLMIQVRSERIITPQQRKRHQTVSDELARLRTDEARAIRTRTFQQMEVHDPVVRQREIRIEDLERELRVLSEQIRQRIPARLQELAATLDPRWLSVVSDPEIEGCGRNQGESWRLRFEFICDKTWSALTPTAEGNVRHCDSCQKDVHYCDNLAEAREHSQSNQCIVVDLGVIRRPDDLNPPMLFMGSPSIEDVRESYEEDIDAVSQARLDERKKGKRKKRQRQ